MGLEVVVEVHTLIVEMWVQIDKLQPQQTDHRRWEARIQTTGMI